MFFAEIQVVSYQKNKAPDIQELCKYKSIKFYLLLNCKSVKKTVRRTVYSSALRRLCLSKSAVDRDNQETAQYKNKAPDKQEL